MDLQTTVTREQIERLEACVGEMPQVDLLTEHALSGGVYARTIYLEAGTVLTGAVHKRDHVNVVVGDISVWTEQGMRRLTGHHVLMTKAGAKRAGYAHADTIWTTVCHTEETEMAAIEADLVEEPEKLQTLGLIAGAPLERLEH